ncbi:MAG: phosphoglycerate kinase, partial [Gemmatimonadetes bacterium]|nr:phosphoglycerate kinase [Gemmatimonadota bacterium]NIT65700.1 phosphoglycerate kinase [Gemmatimonadota bacterium]NIW74172.1 phosphoglycerate kinase [Gemmatimonadota bacterium]NIY34278.1 phosphoglycerate kinase [Gemmatimonadota bacterium]
MPLLKKTVSDIDVADKRVLVRLDLDVSGTEDDVVRGTRIRSGLPTVQYLRDRGARVILCSHQGDPEGRIVEDLRLDPVRDTLEELLGTRVLKAEDCIGPEAQQAVGSLESGDVLLLENTQFHYGESTNYPGFARELA